MTSQVVHSDNFRDLIAGAGIEEDFSEVTETCLARATTLSFSQPGIRLQISRILN